MLTLFWGNIVLAKRRTIYCFIGANIINVDLNSSQHCVFLFIFTKLISSFLYIFLDIYLIESVIFNMFIVFTSNHLSKDQETQFFIYIFIFFTIKHAKF